MPYWHSIKWKRKTSLVILFLFTFGYGASALAHESIFLCQSDPQNQANPGNPASSYYFDDSKQDAPKSSDGSLDDIASTNPTANRSEHITWTKADHELWSQVGMVAQWIQQYVQWNHRFPEQGAEMLSAKQQIALLLTDNPYFSQDPYDPSGNIQELPNSAYPDQSVRTGEPYANRYLHDFAPNDDRIVLTIDPVLSYNVLLGYDQSPPDWQAPSGTITVVSNQQDLYAIWAAGHDDKPLRDPKNGGPKFVIGRFTGLHYSDF